MAAKQVLYVDSLVVDFAVPDFPVRVEAWDNKRIGLVAKEDKNPQGGYGKLRVSFVFHPSFLKAVFLFSFFALFYNVT